MMNWIRCNEKTGSSFEGIGDAALEMFYNPKGTINNWLREATAEPLFEIYHATYISY
jgi:hypothetical protein